MRVCVRASVFDKTNIKLYFHMSMLTLNVIHHTVITSCYLTTD